MFFALPIQRLGFTQEKWENMPGGHRRLIRDYVLNGNDREATMLYGEYESDYQIRKVEHIYNLRKMPRLQLSMADFCIS